VGFYFPEFWWNEAMSHAQVFQLLGNFILEVENFTTFTFNPSEALGIQRQFEMV